LTNNRFVAQKKTRRVRDTGAVAGYRGFMNEPGYTQREHGRRRFRRFAVSAIRSNDCRHNGRQVAVRRARGTHHNPYKSANFRRRIGATAEIKKKKTPRFIFVLGHLQNLSNQNRLHIVQFAAHDDVLYGRGARLLKRGA